MNNIQKDTVAIINYNLRTSNGVLVEERNAHAYLHGYNPLLFGMEKVLLGKQAGARIQKEIPPERAFGCKIEDEELIHIHRDQFGQHFEGLRPGSAIPIQDANGADAFLFVKNTDGEFAVLTRQYPLAGITLVLNAEVLGVRSATGKELKDQTAYGIDGLQKPPSCGC